jgi:excisionase family DNA binding protein
LSTVVRKTQNNKQKSSEILWLIDKKGGSLMLITIRQAAERLSVSTKTIYRRIKDGSLPVVKISEKDYRIDVKDLEAYIEKLKSA